MTITISIEADGRIEVEVSGTGAVNRRLLCRVFSDAFKIKNRGSTEKVAPFDGESRAS